MSRLNTWISGGVSRYTGYNYSAGGNKSMMLQCLACHAVVHRGCAFQDVEEVKKGFEGKGCMVNMERLKKGGVYKEDGRRGDGSIGGGGKNRSKFGRCVFVEEEEEEFGVKVGLDVVDDNDCADGDGDDDDANNNTDGDDRTSDVISINDDDVDENRCSYVWSADGPPDHFWNEGDAAVTEDEDDESFSDLARNDCHTDGSCDSLVELEMPEDNKDESISSCEQISKCGSHNDYSVSDDNEFTAKNNLDADHDDEFPVNTTSAVFGSVAKVIQDLFKNNGKDETSVTIKDMEYTCSSQASTDSMCSATSIDKSGESGNISAKDASDDGFVDDMTRSLDFTTVKNAAKKTKEIVIAAKRVSFSHKVSSHH